MTAEELVRRSRAIKRRLDDHGVPVAVEVTDVHEGNRRTLSVDLKLGAHGQLLVAEMLADRLDVLRREQEDAIGQMAALGTDTMRDA